jgi:hypothetical protein
LPLEVTSSNSDRALEAGSDEKSSPNRAALAHSTIFMTQYTDRMYPSRSMTHPTNVLAAYITHHVYIYQDRQLWNQPAFSSAKGKADRMLSTKRDRESVKYRTYTGAVVSYDKMVGALSLPSYFVIGGILLSFEHLG